MKNSEENFFTMRINYTLLFILLTFAPLVHAENPERRILHQPFFPTASSPPPDGQPPPLPPPVDISTPDQPFFPEIPAGENQYQQPPPPPPPVPAANGANPTIPIAAVAQQTKPAKKVAIVISVGIVTLGMLSALAFFLYRHKVRETRKPDGGSSQRLQNDSREPPSFLYIGTVEPTGTSTPMNEANGSPYRKLSTDIKRSDRYRPSPELQPLPQLAKPSPPRQLDNFSASASALYLSSDEESALCTPQLSSISNEDGCNYTPVTNSRKVNSVPHSKRTSPRSSRFSVASPEMKHVIIPSIKELPPLPPPVSAVRGEGSPEIIYKFPPQRPKFSAPPPPPNMALLRSLNNSAQNSKIPAPPPPPPPVPPYMVGAMFTPNKIIKPLETNSFSNPATPVIIKPQTWTSSPKSSSLSVGPSSSENDRDEVDGAKPRLKPLHWDKVRATSDKATVWDQLKSSSFQLNEDRMETLFGCNSTNSVSKEGIRKSVMPPVEQGNRVLDPKKSQNIAILLRALNVTRDEVSEALLDGNPESLGAELLETLVKMAPTKEEEIKLREYKGDVSKLGSAERFLKTVLDIPFAFKRVEAMLYRANFDTEVKYLRKSFHTLEAASEELKSSRLFLKLLEAVLQTGNRMNVGTNRGHAISFKLDTLLKLVDIKGTDGKTTLLHFVVQEIIKSEGAGHKSTNEKTQSSMTEDEFKKKGLHIVSGLSKNLSNVKKAAGMDSDVLSSYVTKLEMGLQKVNMVLQYENQEGNFFNSMNMFLIEAEEEISRIKAYEKTSLVLVKEVTEYFHGDSVKEEAHPLRIFLIVRDFLSNLDQVCKEIERMHERTMAGSARSFRMSTSASLPVLNRYNVRQDSSDDESLSP